MGSKSKSKFYLFQSSKSKSKFYSFKSGIKFLPIIFLYHTVCDKQIFFIIFIQIKQSKSKYHHVLLANAFIFDVSTDLSGSFIGAVSFENDCIAKINYNCSIILFILISNFYLLTC